MLQNEYILSEIGLDTAEHEQLQNRAEFVHILCKFLRKPAAGFATVPSISAQGTAAGSGSAPSANRRSFSLVPREHRFRS